MSFESEQGHPVWYPIAFALLALGVVAAILTAIYTGDWRWFLAALACYGIIAIK